jgi:putative phage-type endonuclease
MVQTFPLSIGGSQVAAALGVHPYKKPIDLWLELTGATPPFEGNEFTRWGLLLEPAVRDHYRQRHDAHLFVPGEPIYRDGWKRASPDGIVTQPGHWGVEIKTGDKWTAERWGEAGELKVPIEYECQARLYMHVCDISRWDFAALIGGNDYREFSLDRDLELELDLVAGATDFWEKHVKGGVPPEPDGSEQYTRFLAGRWSAVRDIYLGPTAYSEQCVQGLRNAIVELATLEEEKARIEQELRLLIGDAAGLESEHGRITCKTRKGATRTDWNAVAADAAAAGISLAPFIEKHTTRSADQRPLRRPNNWSQG